MCNKYVYFCIFDFEHIYTKCKYSKYDSSALRELVKRAEYADRDTDTLRFFSSFDSLEFDSNEHRVNLILCSMLIVCDVNRVSVRHDYGEGKDVETTNKKKSIKKTLRMCTSLWHI